jgi:hypothetical protein
MNPISEKIQIGTLGELLVQIRLLQYGGQAAAPIKDSGNDLIAVNGRAFRAASVRTTTTGRYSKPHTGRVYDVLTVVHLTGEADEIFLDQSRIFLIPRGAVQEAALKCSGLEQFAWSRDSVERLFGPIQHESVRT